MSKIKLPAAFQKQSLELPYSPVVKIGDFYYFSGVIPNLTEHNEPTDAGVANQTCQVLKKMKKLLADCHLTFRDIFSVTIMLSGSMEASSTVNLMYQDFMFEEDVHILPRRKMFAVAALPFGVQIEIEFDAIDQI